jgi:5-methyltetrahydrofolate--homocysteine methyltransferase
MTNPTVLTEAVTRGDRNGALRITRELIAAGIAPREILQALVSGMDDVGRRFKSDEIFVPEVLVAARAMKQSMEALEPMLVEADIVPEHKVVIGTVKGDLHDIGKHLVAMMLKGANFEVVDLGTDVSAEVFVEAVKKSGACLVGLSALLTTTMPAMSRTVEGMRAAGLTSVKVMVGGAPVTKEFADEIGADGYAPDAASTVDLARRLVAA